MDTNETAPDPDGQYLADMFVNARREYGLTQSELAKKSGTAQSTIARIESGWANPRWKTMYRVAGALGKRVVLIDR